ncbi:MAG: tRNA (adenosine(37)-N6)-threonylcarbamoyltransferase complex ATPase subunit type 1 TsaE [Pseudomonadota bacterium]|nr:tRNA (adenosine(37)-N6)-threonylcarbamoyltransferase complex ATPase subunit type 1 TsaE [Pseudomonadota bacterium]
MISFKKTNLIMNKVSIKSKSILDTIKLGENIAANLERGDLLAVYGELGTGKTTLARSIINSKFFANDPDNIIPSPTFNLIQIYEFNEIIIGHADLYRINNLEEINALDLETIIDDGILIIEWPEKLDQIIGSNVLNINFQLNDDDRIIKLSDGGGWQERIASIYS